jgi:hypothetical protein
MRRADWMQHFDALVQQRLLQRFAWGSNDCVAFVADVLQAMHGRDTLAEFRTQRRCARQAQAQLAAGGGLDAGLARAGLLPVPPAMAGVGDVVLLALGKRRRVLAVCNGAEALSPGRHGLAAMPMHRAVQAWRA